MMHYKLLYMAVKDSSLLKVDSGFVIIANRVEKAHYVANLFDQILTDYYRFSVNASVNSKDAELNHQEKVAENNGIINKGDKTE